MVRPALTRVREVHLSGEAEADKLLSEDPVALLVGMLLDQQKSTLWKSRCQATTNAMR